VAVENHAGAGAEFPATARVPASHAGTRAPRRRPEEEFAEKIRALIKMKPSLKAFHARDSRMSWGPGFPDLVIAGPAGVLFRELKAGTRLSPNQKAWIALLEQAKADVEVWTPADLQSGRIWAQLNAISFTFPPIVL